MKYLLILALFSIVYSQGLNEKYNNQEYEYKNFVVTFENYGEKEKQNIATWKVENDTLTTKGDWIKYLDKLNKEGWEVSRAMPGKWKSAKEVTMVYYLEKIKKKKAK